ncbi:hypothetical protein FSW04_00680 [Baekduia soli]|uniref:Uncharacterized protein n=1 Tax=Baekduia soli TaxID=496014 RepID=A0A5B8TZS8_9ACTN|nr:hypothetical protein [Baekduia soli]QEC46230.1 hypothetical protein FSW04_00680 [Baekduia soli]
MPLHPSLPARSAAAALALLAAGGAATATSAQARTAHRPLAEATYDVVVRATMDETWSFDEQSSIACLPGQCTVETKGSGAAHIALKSKPTRWLVMRGFNGRPPQINVGTGEGAQATGPYLRTGELSTVHGGEWAAANPPEVSPAQGCGNRPLTVDFNLYFTRRNVLAPSASADTMRDDCPDGPNTGLEWDGGDAPSLGDVELATSQTRFLKARSFTVRGTKSWHASVAPPTGSYTLRTGEKKVTWSWEVTFNMKKKGRR